VKKWITWRKIKLILWNKKYCLLCIEICKRKCIWNLMIFIRVTLSFLLSHWLNCSVKCMSKIKSLSGNVCLVFVLFSHVYIFDVVLSHSSLNIFSDSACTTVQATMCSYCAPASDQVCRILSDSFRFMAFIKQFFLYKINAIKISEYF
jgi:hypothetical protein